jgi:hypothetical protein
MPELEWFTAGISGARSIVGKGDSFRMILAYPCRNGTLLNFVAFYTNSQEDAGGQ